MSILKEKINCYLYVRYDVYFLFDFVLVLIFVVFFILWLFFKYFKENSDFVGNFFGYLLEMFVNCVDIVIFVDDNNIME